MSCWVFRSDLSDAVLPMQPSDVLDMPVDPNEPTYCLCHQVSYGEMIGCDNPDVGLVKSARLLKPNLGITFIILNYFFSFLALVSHWVVSLCLCWSRHKAKRKMVRLPLCSDAVNEVNLIFCQYWSRVIIGMCLNHFPFPFWSGRFCPRCTQDRKKKWDLLSNTFWKMSVFLVF